MGSLAVGRLEFVEGVKETLGIKAQHRVAEEKEGLHVLREPAVSYKHHLGPEKHVVSDENMVLLD